MNTEKNYKQIIEEIKEELAARGCLTPEIEKELHDLSKESTRETLINTAIVFTKKEKNVLQNLSLVGEVIDRVGINPEEAARIAENVVTTLEQYYKDQQVDIDEYSSDTRTIGWGVLHRVAKHATQPIQEKLKVLSHVAANRLDEDENVRAVAIKVNLDLFL